MNENVKRMILFSFPFVAKGLDRIYRIEENRMKTQKTKLGSAAMALKHFVL